MRRSGPIRLEVRVATTLTEITRCQRLIADVYNRHFRIVFSKHKPDLMAKIEPFPDRFAMGVVDDQVVGACGLYVDRTYVQSFGGVTDDDIRRALGDDLSQRYATWETREYTKLVVDPAWAGAGIGRLFFAVSHSRDFLNPDGKDDLLVICCAKRSMFEGLYADAGMQSRMLRPFPVYKVHELYSSQDDPMQSRLLVPEADIASRWYRLRLPETLALEDYKKWPL